MIIHPIIKKDHLAAWQALRSPFLLQSITHLQYLCVCPSLVYVFYVRPFPSHIQISIRFRLMDQHWILQTMHLVKNMKMFPQEFIWLDKSILGNDFHMVVNYNGEEKLQISFPGNGSFCNRGQDKKVEAAAVIASDLRL